MIEGIERVISYVDIMSGCLHKRQQLNESAVLCGALDDQKCIALRNCKTRALPIKGV